MKTLSAGLIALTTNAERAEIQVVGMNRKPPIKLQYLEGSAKMGLRLWNVLTPVEGYKSGGDNGFPTFSLNTLKEKNLI